jgi:hypothetical protein
VAGPVRGFGGDKLRVDVPLSMQVQLLDRHGGKDDKRRRHRSAFLVAAAKNSDATFQLPGVAAMNSQNRFIDDLNHGSQPAPGQLRVVSGSRQGGSAFGHLSALLTDTLHFGESDLLVPTSSTFGGVPRAGGASFFLHTGPEVSHYAYFRNKASARAIIDALVLDQPPGFAPIGPLSAAGQSADGLR